MKLTMAAAVTAIMVGGAAAQSAAERVEMIKEWKTNCTNEDPDIQLAYMEAAVTSQGPAIARMCANAALTSDRPSARAMGLSAALEMTDTLTIPYDLPLQYQQDITAADGDEEILEQVNEEWEGALEIAKRFGQSLTLKKKKSTFGFGSSEWFTMDAGGNYDDRFTVNLHTSSEGIKGGGTTWGDSISINLKLQENQTLVGEVFIDESGPFPVVMEIL